MLTVLAKSIPDVQHRYRLVGPKKYFSRLCPRFEILWKDKKEHPAKKLPFTEQEGLYVNFIAICLHCLDMRDFHSQLRNTPFLDELHSKTIFIPMGRGQGHHQGDSLNAEMTGLWTARFSNSSLTNNGYMAPDKCWLPETVIERLKKHGYDVFTCIGLSQHGGNTGSFAVNGGMNNFWLKDEPERVFQFNHPDEMSIDTWLERIRTSNKFYAHLFLRETHRPWAQSLDLFGLAGVGHKAWGWLRKKTGRNIDWPYDAYYARKAALEQPDEFAALRRRGLSKADSIMAEIFKAIQDMEDVVFVIYSNHGEVFDHFRYNQPYAASIVDGLKMIEGTSHGNYPYEVVYANMQMWMIPNHSPRVMKGIGRSIDYAPTILDLAGIKPRGMDGESMISHFQNGSFPVRPRYAESPVGGGCLSMTREDGYKLIALGNAGSDEDTVTAIRGFGNHRLAVFDLNSDPREFVNLINTRQGQEVLDWAIREHRSLKA